MDYSSLPHYPAHDEAGPSQSERLGEGCVAGWEEWAIVTVNAAVLTTMSVSLSILGGGASVLVM
jgi:hypothetical protein